MMPGISVPMHARIVMDELRGFIGAIPSERTDWQLTERFHQSYREKSHSAHNPTQRLPHTITNGKVNKLTTVVAITTCTATPGLPP